MSRLVWKDSDLSDVKRAPLYQVRGLSIDGTVWAMRHGRVIAWTMDKHEATGMVLDDAQRVLDDRDERNGRCSADSIIGQLELVETR